MDPSMPSHGGSSPTSPTCSMNMLWNWQVQGTCVVFRSWHIGSWPSMLFSCLVVALLAFGFEALRFRIALSDRRLASRLLQLASAPGGGGGRGGSSSGRSSPAVEGFPVGGVVALPPSVRLARASSYALSVALSFWLMLVFMTYNGYLIAATVVGAGLGHFVYNREMDPLATLGGTPAKGIACH